MKLLKNMAGILAMTVVFASIKQIHADVEIGEVIHVSFENNTGEDILVTAPDGKREWISPVAQAHPGRRGAKSVKVSFEYDPKSKSLLLTAQTVNANVFARAINANEPATRTTVFRVRPGDEQFKFSIDDHNNLVATKVK